MSGAGHVDPSNRKAALLIAVLAAVLAFSEMLGSSAQTEALSRNIEAANLWSFFQAKTVRSTTLRTAAETLEVEAALAVTPDAKMALEQRIASWKKSIARYDSEPETGEGRKELAARAKAAEGVRDRALAAYHQYEAATGLLQIAIVLASAHVITGAAFLLWGAAGLGVVGLVFALLGFLAPAAVHLF
jgi:hypothetical protein